MGKNPRTVFWLLPGENGRAVGGDAGVRVGRASRRTCAGHEGRGWGGCPARSVSTFLRMTPEEQRVKRNRAPRHRETEGRRRAGGLILRHRDGVRAVLESAPVRTGELEGLGPRRAGRGERERVIHG